MKPIPLPLAELKNALTGLSKIIPRRQTLPILAAVKIERTNDGWVALTATDLDCYATVRLEQPTEGEAATIILPYDELLKTSKVCGKNDTLLVQAEGDHTATSGILTYAVGGQVVDHRCQSFDPEEYPATPRFKGDSIPLPDALRTSIHEAFQCASEDPTRYVLQGAYVDVERPDGHYVVATNGRILYSSNSFKLPLKESLNIPSHKFLGWKEFNNDGPWQLKVGVPTPLENNNEEPAPVQITSRRWRFITKQLGGIYPNWKQCVPSDNAYDTTVEVDPASIGQILQIIERMPCHNEGHMTMALEVKGKAVAFLGKSPSAEQWTRVEIGNSTATGKDVTILLDRRNVSTALKFGLTRLDLSDCMAPVRFSHEGRQLIVMPIRPDPEPVTPPAKESHGKHAINSDAPQPAAEDAAQPHDPMKNNATTPAATTTNGSNGHQTADEKPALELALEQIETTKTALRTVKEGLNSLAETLKQVQREQKSSDKEVASVRSTLERLQSMKL